MEENQNSEPKTQNDEIVSAEVSTPANEASTQPEAKPETVAKQPEAKPSRRNGRNRCIAKRGVSAASQNSSESCGELENPAEFHEKLSGSNAGGYAEGEGYSEEPRQKRERNERGERRERRERGERGFRGNRETPQTQSEDNTAANEVSKNSAPESESAEAESAPEHQGPSFESRKFTPRAVEVGLSDRRSKSALADSSNDGVVSYTPEDSKCTISLFDRIKNIIKSVFGKKDDSKKRFNKKSGKKNWNNNREGGKRYNNNRNGKGGYNKRRFNDRRPNNNGGKPRGNSGGEAK